MDQVEYCDIALVKRRSFCWRAFSQISVSFCTKWQWPRHQTAVLMRIQKAMISALSLSEIPNAGPVRHAPASASTSLRFNPPNLLLMRYTYGR